MSASAVTTERPEPEELQLVPDNEDAWARIVQKLQRLAVKRRQAFEAGLPFDREFRIRSRPPRAP